MVATFVRMVISIMLLASSRAAHAVSSGAIGEGAA